MARNLTPEEVMAEHEGRLGSQLGPLYHALWNDVARGHFAWHAYKALYDTSAEEVETLNRTAASFFWQLRWLLLDDLALRLGRVLDPPRSSHGSRENASFRRLVEIVGDDDQELRGCLLQTLRKLRHAARPLVSRRNRVVAHSDLRTVTGRDILPGFTRRRLEDCLMLCREFMNSFASSRLNTEVAYEEVIESGGADDLLFWLREGLAYGDEKMRRRHEELGLKPPAERKA